MDLSTGRYWPYRKPNNEPLYINSRSNHPPNIIKMLPASIGNRLSSISCDAEAFNDAKPEYENALKSSGFTDYKLEFTPTPEDPAIPQANPGPARRKRRRNILWFNPPFNLSLKTRLAREVLKLVDIHFHKRHRYRRIFNRNTIKVSYSCTKNMASIVSAHNAKVLAPPPTPSAKTCSCRAGDTCPLNGQCLTPSVVYKATVTSPAKPTRHYIGLSEPPFKERWYKHMSTFRRPAERGSTALSQYVWSLKDEDVPYTITWSIHTKAHPYKCGQKHCDLCLTEKLAILRADPESSLNKRSEIATTCRHKPKYRYVKVPDNG